MYTFFNSILFYGFIEIKRRCIMQEEFLEHYTDIIKPEEKLKVIRCMFVLSKKSETVEFRVSVLVIPINTPVKVKLYTEHNRSACISDAWGQQFLICELIQSEWAPLCLDVCVCVFRNYKAFKLFLPVFFVMGCSWCQSAPTQN